MRVAVILGSVLLSACAARSVPIQTQTQVVHDQVRVACPSPEERARLRKLRPIPLRQQPMPASPRERVAKTEAQLGDYESDGKWADQVDAALDRCQQP